VQSHSDGGAIGRAPLLRLGGRALGGAVDAFLFAAEEHAAAWRRAGVVRARHPCYTVIPASTTLRALDRAAARHATAMNGAPALLWVGRLNVNKDPLTVLSGFEIFLLTHPEATLTMIFGTTELLEPVRARIGASRSLRDRVRLVGTVAHADIASYFSAADVFVVGSHHEGSGYSLMEALACGAMPAVTDIPSFRVLTGGGQVGALWAAGDASACAQALAVVAGKDPEGARGRVTEHFERHFSWRAIGHRAMEIYREVIDARRRLAR
jgi:glycosyltransferase involved in cell wall biosynthesis